MNDEWKISKDFSREWGILHYHNDANYNMKFRNWWRTNLSYVCRRYCPEIKTTCDKRAPEHLINLVNLLNFMDKVK